MAKITSERFCDELVKAGLINANDLKNIKSLTIRVLPGMVPTMTVEYMPDGLRLARILSTFKIDESIKEL